MQAGKIWESTFSKIHGSRELFVPGSDASREKRDIAELCQPTPKALMKGSAWLKRWVLEMQTDVASLGITRNALPTEVGTWKHICDTAEKDCILRERTMSIMCRTYPCTTEDEQRQKFTRTPQLSKWGAVFPFLLW